MLTQLKERMRVQTLLGMFTLLAAAIGALAAGVNWIGAAILLIILGESNLFAAFCITVLGTSLVSAVITYFLVGLSEESRESLDDV